MPVSKSYNEYLLNKAVVRWLQERNELVLWIRVLEMASNDLAWIHSCAQMAVTNLKKASFELAWRIYPYAQVARANLMKLTTDLLKGKTYIVATKRSAMKSPVD